MWRARTSVVLLLSVVVLGACSTAKLGYNNADWLAARFADRWFDLDREQKAWFKDRMEGHIEWHRRTEMPRLHSAVTDAQARVADGLDRDDLDTITTGLADRYLALADRLLPDIAQLAATLDDGQIDHLEAELREEINEERDERDDRDRHEAIERIEKWTGRLDEAQRAQVLELLAAESGREPDDEEGDIERRKRRADAFIAALRADASAAELESMLRGWWMGFVESRRESDGRIRMRERSVRVTLGIDALLTDKQREHVIARLDRYRRQIVAIAGSDLIEAHAHAD